MPYGVGDCGVFKSASSSENACLICNHIRGGNLCKRLNIGHPTRRKEMNIRQKFNQYVSRRRAIRELGAMDDHLLADIGVSRSQIQSAVFGK
mgnify:FL=1